MNLNTNRIIFKFLSIPMYNLYKLSNLVDFLYVNVCGVVLLDRYKF